MHCDRHKVKVLALAGAIAALPLALAVGWAIAPVWNALARASDDVELIKRYRALLAQKPAYLQALAAARGELTQHGIFYAADSAELAAAQLQNTLQNLVTQQGGQVRSSEIGTPQTGPGVQTISVTFDCSLPQDHLAQLLAAIDIQKPDLLLQGLDIRATDAGERNTALDVQLTVSGFREAP